tara:strand:+ start:48 stop:485 length:438 start_codon:yes stop_codon:yes gene_type:complete
MSDNSDSQVDLEFVKSLDAKVRTTGQVRASFGRGYATVDKFTGEKVSPGEAKELLRILEASDELFIYPDNICMGFSVGFHIIELSHPPYPNLPTERTHVLTCKEDQLPVGYQFERLIPIFMAPRSLERLAEVGIKPKARHSNYEY